MSEFRILPAILLPDQYRGTRLKVRERPDVTPSLTVGEGHCFL